MSFAEKFGDLVRRRRRELGLTMEQLAESAFGSGDSKSHVSRIEHGKGGEPTAKTVAALAEALQITQKELQALRTEMRDVNTADHPPEDDGSSLKAEPPKIIKHIRWFLDHGASNKLVVLIACLFVAAPAIYTFKDEIIDFCCSKGIGDFSITFSNQSLEATRISQTAEFYITEPESPGVNSRVSSGLLKFEVENGPFVVPAGQERSVIGRVVNEEKTRKYVLEGDKFIEVIFSASPRPVRNEFVLNVDLFVQGLEFEILQPDNAEGGSEEDGTEDVAPTQIPLGNRRDVQTFNENVQPIYFTGRQALLLNDDCGPIDAMASAIEKIQPRFVLVRSHTSKVTVGRNRDLALERGTLVANELHARMSGNFQGTITVVAFGGLNASEDDGGYQERVEVSISNEDEVLTGQRILADTIPVRGTLVSPSGAKVFSQCLLTAG